MACRLLQALRPLLAALLLALAPLGLASAPAHATTLESAGAEIRLSAGDETNHLVVDVDGDRLVARDDAAAPTPCPHSAPCPTAGASALAVTLGGGDDELSVSTYAAASGIASVTAEGGDGSDTIALGDEALAVVRAGAGDDVVDVRNGREDTDVDCGAGEDTVFVDDPTEGRSPDTTVDCEHVLDDAAANQLWAYPQIDLPRDPTNRASATFAFLDGAAGGTYDCRLDHADWAPCVAPYAVSVAEGRHRLELRLRSSSGAISLPEGRTWTVDLTPPTALPVLTAAPAAVSPIRDARFTFAAVDDGDFVACRVDGVHRSGVWRRCSGTTGWRTPWPLADGSYTLRARVADLAGNTGPELAYPWRVAVPAPITPEMPAPVLARPILPLPAPRAPTPASPVAPAPAPSRTTAPPPTLRLPVPRAPTPPPRPRVIASASGKVTAGGLGVGCSLSVPLRTCRVVVTARIDHHIRIIASGSARANAVRVRVNGTGAALLRRQRRGVRAMLEVTAVSASGLQAMTARAITLRT